MTRGKGIAKLEDLVLSIRMYLSDFLQFGALADLR